MSMRCVSVRVRHAGQRRGDGDGEEIELGNTRVKVLHTPGHLPETVCLLIADLKRGAAPWFLLTGDTLFVGAIGDRAFRACSRERRAAVRQPNPAPGPRCAGKARAVVRRCSIILASAEP